MKRLLVTMVLVLYSTSLQAEELIIKDIKYYLKVLDAAFIRQQPEKIAELVTDDFLYDLKVTTSGNEQVFAFNKQQYIDSLADFFEIFDHYKAQRKFLKIVIKGDRAIVTDELHEYMRQDDQPIISITKEKFILLIKDEYLYTTYYTGDRTVKMQKERTVEKRR